MEPKYPTYTIYRHLVLANGKSYIGQTRQNPLDRWMDGYGYIGCRYFYNAIKKYGWDNMEHIILGFAYTEAEADAMEKYYIKKYDTNNPEHGYNLTKGGHGCYGYKPSDETRRKLSEKTKRQTPPNKGLKMSDEEKRKRSIGNKRYWKNHPNLNLGKPMSEEQKKKISKAHMQPVLCVELELVFDSIKSAMSFLGKGVDKGQIGKACKTGGKQYGFHWKKIQKGKDMKIVKNPDDEFVRGLKKRIRDNGGHCINQEEKSKATKCPCEHFSSTGECICGLYIKVPNYDDEE